MQIYMQTECWLNIDWNLIHSTEFLIPPDGNSLLQNFSLSYYFLLSIHSHITITLPFEQRNTSWNRAGVICLELSTSFKMSAILTEHGLSFTFCFPQWTVKCFLTDGGCMTCCHNKINQIPCKNKPVFVLPCGEKKK